MNVISKSFARRLYSSALYLTLLAASSPLHAQEYIASFRNTDIGEFINTVSQNLNKTIILDPAVKGQVSVKSYEKLNDAQYYQFFLSVLEVYGYAVVNADNNVLKVVPVKNAGGVNGPITPLKTGGGSDQIVSRLLTLKYSSAKEVAPLLRPVSEATGGGIITPVSANILLITGRAAVVERISEIVTSIDVSEDKDVDRIKLGNASARQLVDTLSNLITAGKNGTAEARNVRMVADERTNSLLIAGDTAGRRQITMLARTLDEHKEKNTGARVIFLQHAKAENILEVLTGMGSAGQSASGSEASASMKTVSSMTDVILKADPQTNALIIRAPQNEMDDLESIITRLDISRPQVLVEAIIVEIQDSQGLQVGVQWFNKNAGGTRYSDTGAPIDKLTPGGMGDALAGVTGLATGFYQGNWSGLFTALQNNSQNNILATPSIVTMDNKEAEFTVGQEVPVLTGTQSNQSGDSLFNTVQRKSVGIKLKVRPQISKGDAVLLEIEQEVSSVAQKVETDKLGPSFDTRFVKNSVLVNSGSTVVVGGLLDSSNSEGSSSVPLLGRIPILGALFRSDDSKKAKRNLMLFIRPSVIRNETGYTDLTQRRSQAFRQNLPENTRDSQTFVTLDNALNAPDEKNYALQMVERDIVSFYQGSR